MKVGTDVHVMLLWWWHVVVVWHPGAQGHAYSIFRLAEFSDKNGQHQLVQVRNPWCVCDPELLHAAQPVIFV